MMFQYVTILTLILFITRSNEGNTGNIQFGGSMPDHFLVKFSTFIRSKINLSLNYLYTGIGYANQRLEKPGLSNHMKELSETHWNEAIEAIKKYFEREGEAEAFYNSNLFSFQAKNELPNTKTLDVKKNYLRSLKEMVVDSRVTSDQLHKLHREVTNDQSYHDADWSHYFEEKVENEEERTRKLRGYVTNFLAMSSSSLALHVFDSNLLK